MTKRIGFLGLGHMGGPMAANLVRAGYDVLTFDPVPAAQEQARKDGATVVDSAAAAAAGRDVVITMLPNGKLVLDVYADLLPAANPGTLFIDCSTIDVADAKAAAARAIDAGHRALDAPVSGGVAGAAAGTLTFMVGGGADDFADALDVLQVMGGKVVHCGGSGVGQAAKICNNMLLGISMIGTCEAFALAEKLGLDWQKFYDIASKSSGQCWSVTTNCPIPGPVPNSPANNSYEPGFATAMILKDLKLAQACAASAGASAPMGAQAEGLFALFDQLGYGNKDFSAIIQLIRGRLAELA